MRIDGELELFDNVALGAVGARLSNIINLGTSDEANMKREMKPDGAGGLEINPHTWEKGRGRPLYLHTQMGGADADSAADGATLTMSLLTSAASNMAGSVTLASTPAIAQADLLAGRFVWTLALPLKGLKQYVRVVATVGVEDFTAGALNGWIGSEPHQGVGVTR